MHKPPNGIEMLKAAGLAVGLYLLVVALPTVVGVLLWEVLSP